MSNDAQETTAFGIWNRSCPGLPSEGLDVRGLCSGLTLALATESAEQSVPLPLENRIAFHDFHCFASNQTGNTVLLAVATSGRHSLGLRCRTRYYHQSFQIGPRRMGYGPIRKFSWMAPARLVDAEQHHLENTSLCCRGFNSRITAQVILEPRL
jgi:hypothetical protein